LGTQPAGGAGAPPKGVDADGIGYDVEVGRKGDAVGREAREQKRVDRIRAAKDDWFFVGDNLSEKLAFAAHQPEAARDNVGTINPSVDPAPKFRCTVDGGEVGAAGDLVKPRFGQREEVNDARRAGAVFEVAGGSEGAGGGIVAFAVTGGENENTRRHVKLGDSRAEPGGAAAGCGHDFGEILLEAGDHGGPGLGFDGLAGGDAETRDELTDRWRVARLRGRERRVGRTGP